MERLDIGEIAGRFGASIELIRRDLESEETATTDICRLSVQAGEVVALRRAPFRSEGHTGRKVSLHLPPTGAETRKLEDFLADIGRHQARERAVAGNATALSPYPAWSFSVDALAAELARMDGIDLTQCTRPAKWRRVEEIRGPAGRLATVTEAWYWSRTTHHVDGAVADNAEAGSGRTTLAEMKGSALVMRILNPRTVDVFLREMPKGTELQVNSTFPDTAMSAMRGRTVREVLGIDSDHVITSVGTGSHGVDHPTVMKVKGARVPLARAPEGVDTWWLGETGTRGEKR
jgi:hypothetical protein